MNSNDPKIECPHCEGEGREPGYPGDDCEFCDGEGEINDQEDRHENQ